MGTLQDSLLSVNSPFLLDTDVLEPIVYHFSTRLHKGYIIETAYTQYSLKTHRHCEHLSSPELGLLPFHIVPNFETLPQQDLQGSRNNTPRSSCSGFPKFDTAGGLRSKKTNVKAELYRAMDFILHGSYSQRKFTGLEYSLYCIEFRVDVPIPGLFRSLFWGIRHVNNENEVDDGSEEHMERLSLSDEPIVTLQPRASL